MHIVMTGGTSGIGLEAAKKLLERPEVDLVMGVREGSELPEELAGRVRTEPLDLASLASVRAFAARIAEGPAIDALVLNAGLQVSSPQTSEDGYELTFAVNHLAHYLLARLLAQHMAEDGRIILTSSGTHDPDLNTGMPPPRHADVPMLARPELDAELDAKPGVAARRAYTASKLCNVMTARQLAARLANTRDDIMVAAFDPGFTPGTGLVRTYPALVRFVFKRVLPRLPLRTSRMSTPEISGGLLADMVTDPDYARSRGSYFAVRDGHLHDDPPSELARDDYACRKMWEDSATLVGLPAL